MVAECVPLENVGEMDDDEGGGERVQRERGVCVLPL